MYSNRSSLTLNQTTRGLSSTINVNPSTFTFGLQATNSFGTINTTNTFNKQFSEIYDNLNKIRNHYQQKVNDYLSSSNHTVADNYRDNGVELAWKYEKAEIEMGGKGTRDWSHEQKAELLERGRVRNVEGHHINDVCNNPSQQANPDNIGLLEEHRDGRGVREHFDAHERNWRNQTEGELINRNERLDKVNSDRVFKNELTGIWTAVAIGLGIGFTLGFVVTLAQTGITIDSVKNAVIVGGKTSIEGALLGAANHAIIRSIGELVNNSLQGTASSLGLTITDNITRMCNMATVGMLAIIVFSAYQFTKLKLLGYSTKECLLRVGKSAAFSAMVIMASITAQGLWGGHAGIIVSISIGIIVLSYKVAENKYNKKLAEKIQTYVIKKHEQAILGV